MIRLAIQTRPRGQQRARHAARVWAGRRVVTTYTPQPTRAAVSEIRNAWMAAGRERVPDGVPFRIRVDAQMRRPDSHARKDGSPTRAYREVPHRPDVDNILKLVMDALQPDCFADDAACVEAVVTKAYGASDLLLISIDWR